MSTPVREAPHHNTLTCYTNYGCRLPDCVERKNAWARSRDEGLREGTWQPLEDAAPVRAHVARLVAAGLTRQRVADLAGVPHQSIADLVCGRRNTRGMRHRTTSEFAAKILAVDPALASPARVDATGSKRRIQALVAAGWPLLHIGRQMGLNPQRPEQILRQDRVYATTRDIVTQGYNRLHRLQPVRRGVPKDKARLSRAQAEAQRWPTVAYWADRMDVIDDPHFEPMYGVTRRLIVAQDANEVMRFGGLDRQAAADRLGVHKSYLDHALREYPQYAVDVAA
ncbi:hypothetical protein AB0N99_30530 [Streptomyces sp. NPDC093272]|uniref:hypothetical protein n=1 Tax=Streptomyces sp. NPDC093272 TaxID=3154981 RepID=UPI003413A8C5